MVSCRLGHEAQQPDPTSRVKAYNLVGGPYYFDMTGSVFDGWVECLQAYSDLTLWCRKSWEKVAWMQSEKVVLPSGFFFLQNPHVPSFNGNAFGF